MFEVYSHCDLVGFFVIGSTCDVGPFPTRELADKVAMALEDTYDVGYGEAEGDLRPLIGHPS